MLTREQVDRYRNDGFITVEHVLDDGFVADLRCVTDEFVARSAQVTEHDDVYDLEPQHSAASPQVRRIKNPNRWHPVFQKALEHPGILDVVEQLIGPGIRYLTTKMNMKSPGVGSPVEWHRDWAFYPHTHDDILAVGVAIDAMTVENGCLLVVPGSHRGPVYEHHEDGVFIGAIGESIDESEVVPVTVDAGGISIHHVRTLHGSAPNRSADPRRLLLLEMAAVDAWPLKGYGGFEAFNSRILRGAPTSHARVEPVPVVMPEPQPERGGSIYEIQTQMSRERARLRQ